MAVSIGELGRRAAEAYGRPDLVERLVAAEARASSPVATVLVVGEYKQGKSTLVNALVGRAVCAVDDDLATAVPVRVVQLPAGAGEPFAEAELVDEPTGTVRRERLALDQTAAWTTERGAASHPGVRQVDVAVPSWLGERGVVIVDTPGVGGLGSISATRTLAALPLADAVLVVSSAVQELTHAELEVIRHAARVTSDVRVVKTKTDLSSRWRRVVELDRGHLAKAGLDVPLVPVSSHLLTHAVHTRDRSLADTSGITGLADWLVADVAAVRTDAARAVAAEVVVVADLLRAQLAAERDVLKDPARADRRTEMLTEVRASADRLRGQASRWQLTLHDRFGDLAGDLDHDLRSRLKEVTRRVDDEIDALDPADRWSELEPVVYRETAAAVSAAFALLQERAAAAADDVARLLETDAITLVGEIGADDRHDDLARLRALTVDAAIDVAAMGAGAKGFTLLRASYAGIGMFGMLGSLAGITMATPVMVVAGLLMGRKGLRDEQERQLAQRRSQARTALRRYLDEVGFVVGKDARDLLRTLQRHVRDHAALRAEEVLRSATEAVTAAQRAAGLDDEQAARRLADLEAEIARVEALRRRAIATRDADADTNVAA